MHTSRPMNDLTRSTIERLRAHEDGLRALGVRSVLVFGSVARGDAGTASDIDIAVRLEAGFAKGGFEYLGKLERLREQLAEILGRPVDVIEEPVEAQPLQHAIDRERLPAF